MALYHDKTTFAGMNILKLRVEYKRRLILTIQMTFIPLIADFFNTVFGMIIRNYIGNELIFNMKNTGGTCVNNLSFSNALDQ